jgi:non-specific serine/threonine protein kinase
MTRGVAALGDGRHDEAEELLRACLRLIRHHQDRLLVYWCLELLGALAAARGRHRTALQLIGAAMAHGLRRPPRTAAARRDDVLAAAASALGARVADQLVERGSRLTLTRAVEIALNELPATVADTGERLSEREMQVARFVAQGLSNREIAARLVISIRTAEGHVQRILTKRGFTSRTQVAAWAAQLEVDEGEP